jgi:hypothetical protein
MTFGIKCLKTFTKKVKMEKQLDMTFEQPIEVDETPSGIVTLAEARDYVKTGREVGVYCPCCSQYARIYKRKINTGMALALVYMFIEYFKTAKEWIHVEELFIKRNHKCSHDWALLRFWGLIEENKEPADIEKKTNGLWRITVRGKSFVNDTRVRVPSRAIVYNNALIGFSDEQINIIEALGRQFDYAELMKEKIA